MLVAILSRSPNNKVFHCRVRYPKDGIYQGLERDEWVRFNSTRAIWIDPDRKLGMWNTQHDRKKRGRGWKGLRREVVKAMERDGRTVPPILKEMT